MSTKNSLLSTYEEDGISKKGIENEKEKILKEDDKPFCPWIKPDSYCHKLTGMKKFHYEILDFYKFIQLNDEEKELRRKTYNSIQNIIKENFPEYTCELYGSFKTDLSLPNSDIDILILENGQEDNPEKDDIYLLNSLISIYNVLYNKHEIDNLELVKAKVPIIKCIHKETKIHIDISLFKKNGSLAVEEVESIVKIYPEIKPLILVIKYMLRQRDLNEIYKGGISSFIIFTLLYYYIVDVKKRIIYKNNNEKKEKLITLGELLLGFFNFYGFDFNYRKLGISIRNGCFLFRRTDESKNILCVENFQDIKQDMGKSCYQYKKIIDLFKFASRSLTSCTSPVISYLSLFIFPDEILKERNQKK